MKKLTSYSLNKRVRLMEKYFPGAHRWGDEQMNVRREPTGRPWSEEYYVIWNIFYSPDHIRLLYVDLKWDGSWMISDFSTDPDQIVPCERFRDVLAYLTAFRLEKGVNFG